MVLAKVNGVWTIAAHCENGNVQSAAIPANVVAGEAKLTLRYWTNADWTTNAEGELVDGPWVFMSEVKGIAFGNVDYIQKAASAAAAIDALASDADDATKLAALKTYLSWRSHFTAYELAANPMSEKAAAIKATATREKIWAPTNDNLGDIGYDINLNDGKAANQTRPSDWTWIADKDNNAFVQAHYFNFGVNPLTDRTLSFTMPTINYAMYSEVRFAILVQNTNTAQGADLQTLTINGVTAQPSAVSLTTYVVYVKTVNGVTTFEICYNLDSTVVASGTLSSSVAHGFEGLTLDVDVDGWTQVQFYEVFATL